MRKLSFLLFCGLFFTTVSYATECSVIKVHIAEKIKANGVASFTLEDVEKGTVADKKVVGVCGGGTREIIYERVTTKDDSNPNVTLYTQEVEKKQAE